MIKVGSNWPVRKIRSFLSIMATKVEIAYWLMRKMFWTALAFAVGFRLGILTVEEREIYSEQALCCYFSDWWIPRFVWVKFSSNGGENLLEIFRGCCALSKDLLPILILIKILQYLDFFSDSTWKDRKIKTLERELEQTQEMVAEVARQDQVMAMGMGDVAVAVAGNNDPEVTR